MAVIVICYAMLRHPLSAQVFLRCLRISSATVAKSAPPSLSSSLILTAITVTTAITSLHTATAPRRRRTLSINKSNNHSRSNPLTRKKNWPMAPRAPPLPRGHAMATLEGKQTAITAAAAGVAVIETLITLLPEQKVRVMFVRRSSSAACVPGHLLHPRSSMCTLWGMWGWSLTSVNTAARPSVILATSGCISRFTQVCTGTI